MNEDSTGTRVPRVLPRWVRPVAISATAGTGLFCAYATWLLVSQWDLPPDSFEVYLLTLEIVAILILGLLIATIPLVVKGWLALASLLSAAIGILSVLTIAWGFLLIIFPLSFGTYQDFIHDSVVTGTPQTFFAQTAVALGALVFYSVRMTGTLRSSGMKVPETDGGDG